MKLDRNSYGTIALVYLVCGALIFILFRFCCLWVAIPASAVLLWVCGWQTAFHLVPRRRKEGSDKLVSAVSDGRVVIVDKAYEKEFLKRDCIMVSIYMDFWDVHANFWPLTGTVSYTMYHPGEHFLAFKPKASEENEHTCTAIRTADGKEVFFKQLAGGFARRIVCYAKEGMKVEAGEQCGIIKFGSRIDIFLPEDAEVLVKVGDVVRACETVIARL
ncbi:MAG: phosphatidylserine decarboxylase [Bacteroidales bacterium]|nr:phosphatidylserine decarboxylase [Bacteroidales bacterium]